MLINARFYLAFVLMKFKFNKL